MERSDAELVRQIGRGEAQALDELVRRWYPRVWKYVYRLCGEEEDACDLTQDTFLAVVRSVGSYRPWRSFSGWIFTIAHNKCVDYFRLARHDYELQTADEPLAEPFEHAALERAALSAALSRLPEKQREAVVLHYLGGLTAKEIAERTSAPLPTVKSRLKSARRALAEYLRED